MPLMVHALLPLVTVKAWVGVGSGAFVTVSSGVAEGSTVTVGVIVGTTAGTDATVAVGCTPEETGAEHPATNNTNTKTINQPLFIFSSFSDENKLIDLALDGQILAHTAIHSNFALPKKAERRKH